MAEQIFLEEKEIELPSLSSQAGNYIAYFFKGGKWQIEEVELEKKMSDFIPDRILKPISSTKLLTLNYISGVAVRDARRTS